MREWLLPPLFLSPRFLVLKIKDGSIRVMCIHHNKIIPLSSDVRKATFCSCSSSFPLCAYSLHLSSGTTGTAHPFTVRGFVCFVPDVIRLRFLCCCVVLLCQYHLIFTPRTGTYWTGKDRIAAVRGQDSRGEKIRWDYLKRGKKVKSTKAGPLLLKRPQMPKQKTHLKVKNK